MKLTESWGEAKNYSKGEDDGFKMEEGEGNKSMVKCDNLPNKIGRRFSLSLPLPSPALPSPPPLVHFLLAFKMAA